MKRKRKLTDNGHVVLGVVLSIAYNVSLLGIAIFPNMPRAIAGFLGVWIALNIFTALVVVDEMDKMDKDAWKYPRIFSYLALSPILLSFWILSELDKFMFGDYQ